MPLYEYQAVNAQGKASTGLIDAPSRTSAYERVRGLGLFPSQINEEGAREIRGKSNPESISFTLVQLATLLRAGVPLPQAIDSMVSAVPDRVLQRALARIRVRLQEGTSFAQAVSETAVFGPLLGRLVSAGANVGQLDVMLEEYAHFIERNQEFKNRITGAMVYPIVIMFACLALITFVLTNVTPTLTKIYSSFHMGMPWTTRVLLGAGTAVKQFGIFAVLLAMCGGVVFFRFLSPRTRSGIIMRIPMMGQIHLYTQISRWSRTVALLQKGGVPMVKALSSARETLESPALNEAMSGVEKQVERGDSLGATLRRIPLVPPLVSQMAETGERTGELDVLLTAAALFYEKEADRKLSVFVKMLEPAMILLMGVVVGFIVFSVLMPIFQINRMVH
jgi:general secretion pathway protein F